MKHNLTIYALLCVAFVIYTMSIYLRPNVQAVNIGTHHELAISGKLVWQKYNCQSCHQLYGLGGYLGPDLTHVFSAPGRSDAYLRGMITGGNRQMPRYILPEEEMTSLIQFLKETDQSGKSDPRTFLIEPHGMIR